MQNEVTRKAPKKGPYRESEAAASLTKGKTDIVNSDLDFSMLMLSVTANRQGPNKELSDHWGPLSNFREVMAVVLPSPAPSNKSVPEKNVALKTLGKAASAFIVRSRTHVDETCARFTTIHSLAKSSSDSEIDQSQLFDAIEKIAGNEENLMGTNKVMYLLLEYLKNTEVGRRKRAARGDKTWVERIDKKKRKKHSIFNPPFRSPRSPGSTNEEPVERRPAFRTNT